MVKVGGWGYLNYFGADKKCVNTISIGCVDPIKSVNYTIAHNNSSLIIKVK